MGAQSISFSPSILFLKLYSEVHHNWIEGIRFEKLPICQTVCSRLQGWYSFWVVARVLLLVFITFVSWEEGPKGVTFDFYSIAASPTKVNIGTNRCRIGLEGGAQ